MPTRVVALGLLVTALAGPTAAPRAQPGDVRALWVVRTALSSPARIRTMVATARAGGVNTLLVQVRGRGEAYYQSDLEPRAAELNGQPADFDPLALTIALAHEAGLTVHAWVNLNLVASATTLPTSPDHVLRRHPEWLMVPRALVPRLPKVGSNPTAYVDGLARWSRANEAQVEGLYLSPITEAAQDHTVGLIEELVSRYALDGLHLDYVRYPTADFDYSEAALAAYRAHALEGVGAGERERLDRAAAASATAWVDARPDDWVAFRRQRLTALVTRIRSMTGAVAPGLTVSAAVVPDPVEARAARLQDWALWSEHGLLDVICPMAYAADTAAFVAQVSRARAAAPDIPMWAGIGAFRLTAWRTGRHILLARERGAVGTVLFSYDSLAAQADGGTAFLAHVRDVWTRGLAARSPR